MTRLLAAAPSALRLLPPAAALALLAACATPPAAQSGPQPVATLDAHAGPHAHGVPGVGDAQLTPAFWVGQLAHPDRELLSRSTIEAQNARLLQVDPSMRVLDALPATLARSDVAASIEALSRRPTRALFDEAGEPVPASRIAQWMAALDLASVPATQPTRFALVTRRADLRTFPTTERVFSTRGETDIDRFQESALFPGTPVAILHASADGQWRFVASTRYAAWTRADALAEGPREVVLGYATRTPYRLVTGAVERTVHTREQPALSSLALDMGTRLPLASHAPDVPVNGQHPYASWIVELPVRGPDGRLVLAPALLPRIADTHDAPLPLTGANLVRQSFKFLGERYGWGHAYDGRDCSGFVSEVYASMGVLLPRNTSDQARSPALDRLPFDASSTRAEREAAVAGLEVGDLVYIPGHVMMMLGRIDGRPYVIHDTNGGTVADADGGLRPLKLNGVSVTPLEPLMFGRGERYIDRMTSIVRIRDTRRP